MTSHSISRTARGWLTAVLFFTSSTFAWSLPFTLTPSTSSVAPGGTVSLTLAYQSNDALDLGMDFTVGASPAPAASHVTLTAINSLIASILNVSILTNPLLPGAVPNVVSLAIDAPIGGEAIPLVHDLVRLDFLLDATTPSGPLEIGLDGLAFIVLGDVLLRESAGIDVVPLINGQVSEANTLVALLIGLVALAWVRRRGVPSPAE